MNEKDIIAQIRGLSQEEITTWIDNRIEELESTTPENRTDISVFEVNARRHYAEKAENEEVENTEVHGFIPSKTCIKKSMFDYVAFKVDDKSFYKTIVNNIRNADEKLLKNNNYIMHIIQKILIDYFGERGTESKREALYTPKDVDDVERSISDFKRNGTAMCLERSAVGQNILAFLGYDPMLIYGYMSSSKGLTNEHHAYNCIIRDGKAILIDFTNPLCKDGKYYRPASFPIDREHLETFKKGKAQVEVQHKDLYTQVGEVKEDVISLVYGSKEIDPKYFEKKAETQKLGQETQAEQEDTVAKDKATQDMNEQSKALDNKKENSLK